MIKVCGYCRKIIEDLMDCDSTHIHHDNNKCDYNPYYGADDDTLIKNPEKLGEMMDQLESLILEHELFCPHQLYYHAKCCSRCSKQLAKV